VPIISYRLHYRQSQTPVLEIIPDPSGLYRIAWPDINRDYVAFFQYRPFVAAGGLVSYGSDETEGWSAVMPGKFSMATSQQTCLFNRQRPSS